MDYIFEKLDVWKKAKDFVVNIFKVSAKFPAEKKF